MGEGWSVRWTDAKHRLAKADGQNSLGTDRGSVPAGQEVGISDQARCRASKPFAEWHPTGGKCLGRLEQENARLKAQVAAHDMGIEVMALMVSGCSGVFADGLPSTPLSPDGLSPEDRGRQGGFVNCRGRTFALGPGRGRTRDGRPAFLRCSRTDGQASAHSARIDLDQQGQRVVSVHYWRRSCGNTWAVSAPPVTLSS